MEQQKKVLVNCGNSNIYSYADINDAMNIVRKKLEEWKECTLQSISYTSDACASEENVRWMNSLREGKNYTESICIKTDFHTSKDAKGAWGPDCDYPDYTWWMARTKGGPWELLNWGYC